MPFSTMGTADFLLNCFVLGDDEKRVFPVEIEKDKNVGIPKKSIKEGKAPHLDHVGAASDLSKDVSKAAIIVGFKLTSQLLKT